MDFYEALDNASGIFDKLSLEKEYFIKLVFGERDGDIAWRDLGDALTDYVYTRAFIQYDEVFTMMYLDSFEKGFAIASLAYLFTFINDDITLDELIEEYGQIVKELVVKGKGPWVIWEEEEIVFFKTLEDATDRWLGKTTNFATEPSPASAQALINATTYKKIESIAKEVSVSNKKPFNTYRELAEAAYRK